MFFSSFKFNRLYFRCNVFFFFQLHLDDNTEAEVEETNELDFFKQHENLDSHQNKTLSSTEDKTSLTSGVLSNCDNIEKSTSEAASNYLGPSVKLSDHTSNVQHERKSTIGCRKAQSGRSGVSSCIND